MKFDFIDTDPKNSVKCQTPNDGRFSNLQVVMSPVGNCQTFSVRQAKEMLNLKDDEFGEFLAKMSYSVGRKQMIIDLEKSISEKLISKIEPYANKIMSLPYTSTNGSEMVLYLVQFNYLKLVKIIYGE